MSKAHRMKVLLIDDSTDYYLMTKRFLARSGDDYVYDHTVDFAEGLVAVQSGEYDVYLVDHQIGPHNGLDIIETAMNHDPATVCIMVTGQSDPAIEQEALRLGAADYIEKIISDPNYLDQVIRKALHRAEFRRAQKRDESSDGDDSEPFRAALAERDTYIEQLTILHQVDEELSHIASSDAVLSLAIDASMRLSGATAGFIGLSGDDPMTIEVTQVLGNTPKIQAGEILMNIPLFTQIIRDGIGVLITDPDKLNGNYTVNPDSQAQMLIPLNSHEHVLGLLCLECDRVDRFNDDIFQFIKLIAYRIGVAVENALLYRISQDQLAELQKLYNRLSQLEQLKSDMIRMAAHDLRNPISVIQGYVGLLRRVQDPERREGYLHTLEVTAKQMSRITTDILSLERIEKMQAEGGEIIRELMPTYQAQAEMKSQTLKLTLPQKDICVLADSAQIHEAIGNLISNALKYTQDEGKVEVRLTTEADMAIIEVEDNGYGIPEAQQKKLFQPFFRAKMDETYNVEGTGLGLYLIKSIVERFSGEIIFRSEYGKGSVFGFRLPLA